MSGNIAITLAKRLLWFVLSYILPVAPVTAMEQIRVGIYDNPPKVYFTPDGFTTGLYPELLNTIANERGGGQ